MMARIKYNCKSGPIGNKAISRQVIHPKPEGQFYEKDLATTPEKVVEAIKFDGGFTWFIEEDKPSKKAVLKPKAVKPASSSSNKAPAKSGGKVVSSGKDQEKE